MENTQDIAPSITRFAEVARRYCTWTEGEFGEPQPEMQRARLLLAELYLLALGLPDLGIGDDIDAPGIPDDEHARMFQKLGGLPLAGYWDVFNPLEEDQPVFNSLADDLADIYRDLKPALSLYDSGHPVDATWAWRFGFQTHWGQHLVGAQRALHEYLSGKGL